jgi:beta-galactosidase GanA
VKNKYKGDLDLLNREWGSEFPVDYLSWDEVEPGLEAGFAGGYLPAMDWFSFNEEKITANVKRVNDLIKKVDNQHPTTVNIITYADRELNYFNNVTALGKAVDIIGYSHYLFSDKPYETAANLDIIRSASNDPDRKYWIIETEAGPLRYYGDFYSGSGEGSIREKANWQAVAHGVKTILLWKYRGRISDKQTDEYNLMAWDGGVTERAKKASRISGKLQKLAAVINPGKNISQVAIFHSDVTRKYVNLDDGSLEIRKKWLDSRNGAYKVLWDLNIPVDFVNETQIVDGALHKYKMLIIPFGAVIARDVANRLKEFVANGGNVVADFYLGAQKENCRINYQAPGEGLDKVFGGYYNDIVTIASVTSDKIAFTEHWDLPDINAGEAFCELNEYPDTEVVARYASGRAAIIKNQYGKGIALMCGSGIFAGYLDGKNPGVKTFIKEFLNESRIIADAEINMPQAAENQINNIEICQLSVEKQNDSVWMIVNHNEVPVKFSLRFSNAATDCEFYDLLDDQKITANENAQLQLSMPAFATFMLMPVSSELCRSLINFN